MANHKEEGDEEMSGRGERKVATSRVIARISKCVYKLGHRRVCPLIRQSDAEERGGGGGSGGTGRGGGSRDSPSDKGIGC